MLPLLLMLIQDPAASAVAPPDPSGLTGTARLTVTQCAPGGFQRIERSGAGTGDGLNNLMFTPQDEVRRYRLLERTVRGCSAPISFVVPYRQGGVDREAARPDGNQPPRSSE